MMDFKDFRTEQDLAAKIDYIIIEVSCSSPASEGLEKMLLEGEKWKPSGCGDLWYRISPARPELKQLRHVHIAHKKHIKSNDLQVSWKVDQSRHDKKSFDNSFAPLDTAKKIARRVLKLPKDAQLEQIEPTGILLNESVEPTIRPICLRVIG